MARETHVATVASGNTARTVEVVRRPSGGTTGRCSDNRCEPIESRGGNDVMNDAREHLRWQHQ